ncbi:MAG: hypothetical protein EDM72_13055 [Chlorobiota bacterium]|nr:MAG: hypothetical protein EDM72_13055 [Chlorobiota bacterium]
MAISSHETATKFKAMVTQNQFRAIAAKIEDDEIAEHLNTHHIDRRKVGPDSLDWVLNLLINGWNSEYCIGSLLNNHPKTDLTHLIQWLFPQAYYSVATIYHAYLRTVNQTAGDHTGLLKNYSRFLTSRNIDSISYFAVGPKKKIEIQGLSRIMPANNLKYTSEPSDIDGHIASFLVSTHEDRLNELAAHVRKHDNIKRLNQQKHFAISKSAGCTTLINLLYRKRIKSNYRDIDTYFDPELNAIQLFSDVSIIVGSLNWLVEGYIQKILGPNVYNNLLNKIPNSLIGLPKSRIIFESKVQSQIVLSVLK